jgi:seryl-tRNA synthetase
MIDIKDLRDDIHSVEKALARRGYVLDKERFINLDAERKLLQTEVEALQSSRKNLSNDFGKLKAKNKNESLNSILSTVNAFMLDIPNTPHHSVPDGIDENQNVVIRTIGKITSVNTIDHIDITKKIDTDLGAKLAGARFSVLSGDMAKLQRSLITFMLDVASKNGYKEYYLPLMANVDSLTATGNLPKFAEDLFKTTESLYLIPTAEVPLTNLYRNELIPHQDVPLKLTAHTSCFRSEAGSYGKDTKGLIRQHQFEKIELVQVTKPETSLEDLNGLLDNAEEILQLLELPYQVVELCAGDLGFSSCKTFDIEVWIPSQSKYREISSCSNFSDFQSRRANIKIQTSEAKILAHTINGSALAVGRTLLAIIENNYNGKDSIQLPQVLHDYFGASFISI